MVDHLYLHVPFCKSICYYCDFCHRLYNEKMVDEWLNEVGKEIKLKNINKKLKTIYIGGGTPTSLSYSQLKLLLTLLKPYSSNVLEYTIEINPETIDIDKILLLKEYGINRVSIGIQSFNDHLLKMMNRKHTKDDVLKVIKMFRDNDITNITCDLMYSLPNQSTNMFISDIKQLIDLKIPHLSFYSLTIEENTVFYKKGYDALDCDIEADMYIKARDLLTNFNYNQYEISNYCLKGYESKHNIGYWLYDDFYGIGMGASGKENHLRYDNTKSFQEYLKGNYIFESIKLSKDEEIFEALMMNSRLKEGIDILSFNERYDIDLLDYYNDQIKNNPNVRIVDNHLIFNRDILNTVLVDFIKE